MNTIPSPGSREASANDLFHPAPDPVVIEPWDFEQLQRHVDLVLGSLQALGLTQASRSAVLAAALLQTYATPAIAHTDLDVAEAAATGRTEALAIIEGGDLLEMLAAHREAERKRRRARRPDRVVRHLVARELLDRELEAWRRAGRTS